MSNEKSQELLAALSQQYQRSLKEYGRAISEKWRRLSHLSWDEKGVRELQEIAHKLIGSGTTFGHPRITETARQLESALLPLLEGHERLDAEQRITLDKSVNALQHAINEALASPAVIHAAPLAPPPAKRIKVALIEDDLPVAEKITLWLQALGHSVARFATPESFTSATLDHHFDLLILDISFPGAPLGGITWLESSRERLGKNLPVLMISARTDLQARVRALRAGAAGYLIKPIDYPVLEEQINTLLAAHRDNQVKVLLVDDDLPLCELYRGELEAEGFSVSILTQPHAILDVMERYRPDIIVLDYQMPGINGIEVARVLRQEPRYMETPIIFLTANANSAPQKSLFGIVGNALLNKPLPAAQLVQQVRRQLQQARAAAARLHMALMRQSAEGLQNRSYFLAELQTRLTAPHGKPQATELLLHLAINNTPFLKQRLGLSGAAHLDHAIETFLSHHPAIAGNGCCMGDFSYLVRFWLDDYTQAPMAVKGLLDALASRPFSAHYAEPLPFACGGIALGGDITSVDSAITKTEQLYLEALTLEPPIKIQLPASPADNQKAIDSAIREALEQQRYRLNYQPIINLGNESQLFEALIRLHDSEGNEYLPNQFFSILESMHEEGLATLDRWVVEHVFDEITHRSGTDAPSIRVIIKITPQQERMRKLLFYIANVLQNSRARHGKRIFFALPMEFIIRHDNAAREFIKGLHDLNCGIMVEHYTKEITAEEIFRLIPPPDFIKLDATWNKAIRSDEAAQTRLKRIIELMGSHGHIVASTVEDHATLSAFWELGVRDFQGYFLQRPGKMLAQDSIESQAPLFM